MPVHKIDFDAETWAQLVASMRDVPFVRRYVEQCNLRFSKERVSELPGEIRTWIAKTSGSATGWHSFDGSGFVLSEFVGRGCEIKRYECCSEKSGALDVFFDYLLPDFTLLNISQSWCSGGRLPACVRRDVTVFVQDRYLFSDPEKYRRPQLEALLRGIRSRLVNSDLPKSLRVVLCCDEQGLKPFGFKRDVGVSNWMYFEEELDWFWNRVGDLCDECEVIFEGGCCGVLPHDFADSHLYHCRFMIWDDLTVQWAVGPRRESEVHWVRGWSHLCRSEDLHVSQSQWERFKMDWNDEVIERFSFDNHVGELEWDVWY